MYPFINFLIVGPQYLGERCYFTEQCSRIDVNSLCGQDFTCICNSGRFESRDKSTCHNLPTHLDQLCHDTSHCTVTLPNSTCSSDSCVCPGGFFPDRDNTFCQHYAERTDERCLQDEHCSNINQTECTNYTCSCTYGYMSTENRTECVPRPTLEPYIAATLDPPNICNPDTVYTCGTSSKLHCVPYSNHPTITHCRCIPGYYSYSPYSECLDVQTYLLEVDFHLRAERYDYLPLTYTSTLADPFSSDYLDLKSRVTESGINHLLRKSNHSNRFVNSEIFQVSPAQSGVKVLALFHIIEDIHDPIDPEIFYEFFSTSLIDNDGELGESMLKVGTPYSSYLTVKDFDECNSTEFNDCSPSAWCINTMSSFMCVCKSAFDDISHDVNKRPGRECIVPTTTPIHSESCSSEDCETKWEYVGLALVFFLLLLIGFIVYEIIHRKQEISARDIYARFNRATRQSMKLLRKGSSDKTPEQNSEKKKKKKKKLIEESSVSVCNEKGLDNPVLEPSGETDPTDTEPNPQREEMEIS